MSSPAALTVDVLAPRLSGAASELTGTSATGTGTGAGPSTVIDVRTPGEYGSGHVPGAYNIPLDRLGDALPELRALSGSGGLVVVCASGARSGQACRRLADEGIVAASLEGGTEAWASAGHPLERPAGSGGRAVWPMERQVRLTAGLLVLLGLLLDLVLPGARVLSFLIGGGLVYSALSNTCGMAAVLGKLPYNRRAQAGAPQMEATLGALRERAGLG